MNKGIFITLEGIDGSGKSTQGKLLHTWMGKQGYQVMYTREPGGTWIGEQIRSIVLNNYNTAMDSRAEFLLFSASRAQHTRQFILPTLKMGISVICDRYSDSSIAYQGYGRQSLDLDGIFETTFFATFGLKPDITFFLDVDPEKGYQRSHKRNRLDKEELEFYKRVRAGYLMLSELYQNRWITIDANRKTEDVHRDIIVELKERLKGLNP